MTTTVAVLLAPGFEEIEAVGIIDILRRANLTVLVAAVDGAATVRGSHGLDIGADVPLAALRADTLAAAILPGGMPGSETLAREAQVLELLRQVHGRGGIAAAICAAPLALQAAGLLQGCAYTCYPGIQDRIGPGWTGAAVETAGRIVTGKGPGAVFEFALALAARLADPATAESLRKGMLVPGRP